MLLPSSLLDIKPIGFFNFLPFSRVRPASPKIARLSSSSWLSPLSWDRLRLGRLFLSLGRSICPPCSTFHPYLWRIHSPLAWILVLPSGFARFCPLTYVNRSCGTVSANDRTILLPWPVPNLYSSPSTRQLTWWWCRTMHLAWLGRFSPISSWPIEFVPCQLCRGWSCPRIVPKLFPEVLTIPNSRTSWGARLRAEHSAVAWGYPERI